MHEQRPQERAGDGSVKRLFNPLWGDWRSEQDSNIASGSKFAGRVDSWILSDGESSTSYGHSQMYASLLLAS